jgi:hypothetical protein
MTWPEAL